jgi:phosphoglycolate phosphatase
VKRWSIILWDLDGTITDPKYGIIESYMKVLEEEGLPCPTFKELEWVIGPPIRECIQKVFAVTDPTKIEFLVARFRHWYGDQKLMNQDTPYTGIKEILLANQRQGLRQYVATSKAHPYARQILTFWKLDHFFLDINGSELDGTRSKKSELLKWMAEKHGWKNVDQIVMIGDRHHDIDAANANGIDSIGVTYGYGGRDELVSAGATYTVETIGELQRVIQSNTTL